jgi:hypothetical protein
MERTYIALACAALSLTACTSAGSEPDSVDGSALSGDVAVLPELDVVAWGNAIASCEGVIDGTESYAVAQPAGLVVAVGAQGAICVDTLPAMQEELAALGVPHQAEDLAQRYWATLDAHPLSQSTSGTMASAPPAGEPNPQPSLESVTAVELRSPVNEGEPNPQPSGPAGGEPNPQPSGETQSGSTGDTPPDDGTKPPPPMPRI